MIITTDKLGKRFNREWIFKDFSYSFQPGTYAIVGPNGSGKSTLLQVMWGQLPASSGTIEFASEKKVDIEAVHRHLAIATPYMELIEELTLLEILKFHFSFKKIRGGKTLEELLELLELTHAKNKTISHFSSGMKQRLKLGLAFFSDVDMIFLDEPTTNLDKQAIAWYWDRINGLGSAVMVFIGSNMENEYPANATKINLLDYK